MVELLTKLLMPMRRLQARLKRVQEGSYMVFSSLGHVFQCHRVEAFILDPLHSNTVESRQGETMLANMGTLMSLQARVWGLSSQE